MLSSFEINDIYLGLCIYLFIWPNGSLNVLPEGRRIAKLITANQKCFSVVPLKSYLERAFNRLAKTHLALVVDLDACLFLSRGVSCVALQLKYNTQRSVGKQLPYGPPCCTIDGSDWLKFTRGRRCREIICSFRAENTRMFNPPNIFRQKAG